MSARPRRGRGLAALQRRRRAPGRRSERGAVVVEAALVTPILALLVFGMIEVAMALKSHSSTAHAVRSAGRVASVAAADPMSDQRVLARLAEEIVGIGGDDVELVVVWHATGPGDRVPEACRPATLPDAPNGVSVGVGDGGFDAIGACNVYVRPDRPGGAFDMATGRAPHPPHHYFGCEGADDPAAGHKVDCSWPGKVRRAVVTPRESAGPVVPPDFVGLFVQVRHSLGADLVLDAITISDATVNLIEPQGYGLT